MKILERFTDLKTRIQLGVYILEPGTQEDKFTHIHVPLWTQRHHIAKGAKPLLGERLRPDEVTSRSTPMYIIGQVLPESTSRMLLIPLQGLLLSIHCHQIDNALSSIS